MAKAKKSTLPNFVKLNAYVKDWNTRDGTHEVFIRPSYVRLVTPRVGSAGSVIDLTSGGVLYVADTVAQVMALIDPPQEP